MKKKIKKAFTLVELLVVIAILAILATVSIVGYNSFTKKAKVSNDTALVSQLNNLLKADSMVNGDAKTPTDALKITSEAGYDVEKLTPTTNNYEIIWNQAINQFALLDEKENVVYGEKSDVNYKNWKFVTAYDSTSSYSMYLKNNSSTTLIDNLNVGVDVGNNANITSISYTNATAKKDDVIIRSNSFDTTINVTVYENGTVGNSNYESDTINHYGYAKEVVLNKAGNSSYHEFGKVGFITLHEGKLVVENKSNVITTYIPDSSKSYDIIVNNGTLKDVYAKMPSNAVEASQKITDSKVVVKSLTNDETTSEDIITSIVDTKKTNSKNEALDSEVNNGNIKVEGAFRVGSEGYNSLDEAIFAAKTSKTTLALQASVIYENENNIELVSEGETLTIDLNGFEWKPSTKWYTIQNKGTLTIKDSSTNKSGKVISYTLSETGSSLIDNWGTLTIDGGNYNSKGSTVVKNEPNANLTINDGTFELSKTVDDSKNDTFFYNAILNCGTATINNGTFTSNAGSAVWNGKTDDETKYSGTITINNGIFISTCTSWSSLSVGAVHQARGTMTINNGTFIGDDTAIYYNNYYSLNTSKLYIYDGLFSFTSNYFNSSTFYNNGANDTAEIYGGIFKGFCFMRGQSVELFGGTYEQADLDDRVAIADGYEIVDNGNNTWTVKKSD